jgi:hypothetical protein
MKYRIKNYFYYTIDFKIGSSCDCTTHKRNNVRMLEINSSLIANLNINNLSPSHKQHCYAINVVTIFVTVLFQTVEYRWH